jgi:hypothetical protein
MHKTWISLFAAIILSGEKCARFVYNDKKTRSYAVRRDRERFVYNDVLSKLRHSYFLLWHSPGRQFEMTRGRVNIMEDREH